MHCTHNFVKVFWFQYNNTLETNNSWNETVAEELYDHSENNPRTFDGHVSEAVNLLGLGSAIESKNRAQADQLKEVLIDHFTNDY